MNDLEREETLRRLLSEAVDPIHASPDAQTRLQRKLRIGPEPRKRFWERAGFGWAATGLATAGIIVLAVLFVHVRGSDSSKSSSAAAGSASSASSAALPEATRGAHPPASPDLAAGTGDLDGDGQADSVSVVGGMLVARLSRDGSQSIALPPTGPGVRVVGITQLAAYSGGRVPVALVRLQERSGYIQDTVAAVVAGRLTLLQVGSGPALLTVDASHGYACNDGELVVSGNPAAYVVQGDQLVTSPRLRAVIAPVGRVTGC